MEKQEAIREYCIEKAIAMWASVTVDARISMLEEMAGKQEVLAGPIIEIAKKLEEYIIDESVTVTGHYDVGTFGGNS